MFYDCQLYEFPAKKKKKKIREREREWEQYELPQEQFIKQGRLESHLPLALLGAFVVSLAWLGLPAT